VEGSVMRAFLRAGLVGLALVLAAPAAGQDSDKGHEAYERGDYESLGGSAKIRVTRVAATYIVAVDHAGVAADLSDRWRIWDGAAPAGFVAFVADNTGPLHALVAEVWRLARALPVEPLRAFEAKTRDLPRNTEVERLVVQRVGQDIFRDALMAYWNGRCAVTGVAEPRLLRASHIRPWAKCETDAERLDVHNGLLLAAHLDAAFDAGLISFADDGAILFSSAFAVEDRRALGINPDMMLKRVVPAHVRRLHWHREDVFLTEKTIDRLTT
jgi:putative restriction endonuclease